jgi:RNA polymerase sigma factor (sigma-70 family)
VARGIAFVFEIRGVEEFEFAAASLHHGHAGVEIHDVDFAAGGGGVRSSIQKCARLFARKKRFPATAFFPMPPPDSELGQWFATHVQPHEPVLRAWLRSRFRTEDDLDDLVQESYLRLLRARERGEVTSPKAFLFAVARNLALDRFRHREVLPTESLAENEEWAVLDEGGHIPDLIAHNQELALLTEAIQSLPDRCRQIFTLRKVYGLSQAEILSLIHI